MITGINRELEWKSKHYDEIQKQTLFQILRRNSQTEYGEKYNFREINSEEKFREKVPLSEYSDYKDYITRMVYEGEKKLIVNDRINYYAVSSGTAGEPKYFPVTEIEILFFIKYAYFYSYEIIENFLGRRLNLHSNVKIRLFLLNEIRCAPMGYGIRKGIISGIPFDYLKKKKSLLLNRYTSPLDVLFPEEDADMFYLRLRFALGCEDVKGILGTYVHQLLFHMKYMEDNWEMIVDDIGRGTISDKAGISYKVRSELKKYITPMPERADFLSKEFLKGFGSPIVPRLWKDIKFTMGIGGETFGKYMDELRWYTGDIPHHCFIYASSEGLIAPCRSMGDKGEYFLIPDSGYYEFLTEGGNLADKRRLKEGERYELVFTGYSGLYRYKMKDVIEIVDIYNKMPVFKFAYRKDSLINIAGEKTKLCDLTDAAERFGRKCGILTNEFCIYPSEDKIVGKYIFLMEMQENMPHITAEELGKRMDHELRRQSFDYDDCRSRGEIGMAEVHFVKGGAFREYTDLLRNTGVDTGQLKPVRLLNTEEKRRFFNDRIVF